MKILAAVLSAILPVIIDYIMKYQQKHKKKVDNVNVMRAQTRRLNDAVTRAYDGRPITDDQRKEVIDAARDLITSQ